MLKSLHEVQESASFDPLHDRDLAAIKDQLVEWDRAFGPGVVALWLFDTAFHRVYQAKGFEFANKLLTQTRHSLRRSEGSASLDWLRRCKQQAKAEIRSKTDEMGRRQTKTEQTPVLVNALQS